MQPAKIWSKKYPPAKNIDAFIKASPKKSQAKLKQLRKIIKICAPKAVETISYRMPVFKLNGKGLAGFAGYEEHIGFYPMSGSFLKNFKEELASYDMSKGTVQLPLDKPLPVILIKKMVKAKMKEIKI
jgi:uncharacterized protein YdhG (YjbR/CyaY superfamily)